MRHLKVGVFADPPWVNENWHNESKPGVLIEALDIFCQSLKVKCDLIESPEFGYGDYTNGSWHGMTKYIADRTFDLSFPGFTPTAQRWNVVDFTNAVYKVPLVLVTSSPESDTLSLLSFMAFDWTVWLCLLVASVFIGLFVAFNETNQKWKPKKIFKTGFIRCLDTFAIMSNQGVEMETVRISVRLLITFWALATLILGGVYSGHLLSFMIRQNADLPFKDFDTFVTCVEAKKCQLVTNSLSISFYQDIFTNKDESFVRLNNALTENPIKIVPNRTELATLLLATKNVFLTWYTLHPNFMTLTKNNKNCLYAKVESSLYDDVAFPLPKNSTIKDQLNVNITYIKSMGVLNKIYNDYIGQEGECTNKQIEGSKPLPFTSIVGLLFVLACGGLFGLGGLLCENIIFRRVFCCNNGLSAS